MIKGTTASGFDFLVQKKMFHSMKFIKKSSTIKENSSAAEMIELYTILLGDTQMDALMEHCDDVATDEKYADEICAECFQDIFLTCSKDEDVKNS